MPSHPLQMARHLALAISFSAIVCVSGGCNFPQSVNPFYRPQDVVFDASLLGMEGEKSVSESEMNFFRKK